MESTSIENNAQTELETLKGKFKKMYKSSELAKYLSATYAVLAFVLAFKNRDELVVCLPLIASGLLVLVYTITHLWLKGITTKSKSIHTLILNIRNYKRQTLKREKYELFVMVMWALTLVPVFLEGKNITSFLVMKMLFLFYIFIIIGNSMFKAVKQDLKEMDQLINKIA